MLVDAQTSPINGFALSIPEKEKNKPSFDSNALTSVPKMGGQAVSAKQDVNESLPSAGAESSDFDPNLFVH